MICFGYWTAGVSKGRGGQHRPSTDLRWTHGVAALACFSRRPACANDLRLDTAVALQSPRGASLVRGVRGASAAVIDTPVRVSRTSAYLWAMMGEVLPTRSIPRTP